MMEHEATFYQVVRGGLSEKYPLDCDLNGANRAKMICGKSTTGRGNSNCKGS